MTKHCQHDFNSRMHPGGNTPIAALCSPSMASTKAPHKENKENTEGEKKRPYQHQDSEGCAGGLVSFGLISLERLMTPSRVYWAHVSIPCGGTAGYKHQRERESEKDGGRKGGRTGACVCLHVCMCVCVRVCVFASITKYP